MRLANSLQGVSRSRWLGYRFEHTVLVSLPDVLKDVD